jgi:predicted MFS family arabinose efflux permease
VRRRRQLRPWFVIFFVATGISALLGLITHGFLSDFASTVYRALWAATLLAIGIAALAGTAIGARLLFSTATAKRVLALAALLFAAYAAIVLLVSQSFAVAIVFYVPAAVFLLIAFALTWRRHRRTYVLAGIAGLVLSFAGAAIQQSETGLASLGLTHNALYHLVQAVALVLIFAAAVGLTRENGCRHDAPC